jgi:DMSO/TMAO reductase YedYZ molybdopterin-dependent catalytic subunit
MADHTVTVTGAVRRPTQVRLQDLLQLGNRRTRTSDLHCATTWSAVGLTWGGVPFREVHEVLAPQVGLTSAARWVTFVGLDGYRCCLRLDDALAADVLLADRLDDAPLEAAHGAPLRLVAPAHYGYKSVKHVCAIEYRRSYERRPSWWVVHPRGRVAQEERSRVLPGPLWRLIWRRALPGVRRAFEKADAQSPP